MTSLNDLTILLFVIIIAAIVSILILQRRDKGKNQFDLASKNLGFEEKISTALLRYKATSRFERVVQSVVKSRIEQGNNVLLVSSAPRADSYASSFAEAMNTEVLMIVKLSASSRMDRFYVTYKGEKKEEQKKRIHEISVDWLEYLSEMIEGLSKNSSVIFEPLSDVILINGFEKTFKFVKKTVDYCVEHKIQFISFLNDEAHEENIKASFEGLFTKIGIITENKIEIVK